MKCPEVIKEAMRVIHNRMIAGSPEIAKKLKLNRGGISDIVIYKPFLRRAKYDASEKYDNLIQEQFFGLSNPEVKKYESIKSNIEKIKWVKGLIKKRGLSARTTLRSRKPLIFKRKSYEKAISHPLRHMTLFNKDKSNLKTFLQTSKWGFGRFKTPLEAYRAYNRKGWN